MRPGGVAQLVEQRSLKPQVASSNLASPSIPSRGVAQLVEQRFLMPQVVGSSPTSPSRKNAEPGLTLSESSSINLHVRLWPASLRLTP